MNPFKGIVNALAPRRVMTLEEARLIASKQVPCGDEQGWDANKNY